MQSRDEVPLYLSALLPLWALSGYTEKLNLWNYELQVKCETVPTIIGSINASKAVMGIFSMHLQKENSTELSICAVIAETECSHF